jgi:hypothetical protein
MGVAHHGEESVLGSMLVLGKAITGTAGETKQAGLIEATPRQRLAVNVQSKGIPARY